MPVRDRKGPAGQGPMTGKAAGYCTGHHVSGFMYPGRRFLGRGVFGGRGRGMMHRHWYYAAGHPGCMSHDIDFAAWGMPPIPCHEDLEPAEESKMLKKQADYLKKELDDIQERLSELQSREKSG